VLENEGGSYPRIDSISVATNFARGALVLEFCGKSIGDRCLYLNSSSGVPICRFNGDGSITKLSADNYGPDSVHWIHTELTVGWSQYKFWVCNGYAIREGVLFTLGDEVEWGHSPNDPTKGWYLCPVPNVPVVLQDHALTVADVSGNAYHLTETLADAPLYQAADGTSQFPCWVPARAILWSADGYDHKHVGGEYAALNAALSGDAPVTVMGLVRVLWMQGLPDQWFEAVASAGNGFTIGVDASGSDSAPHVYAGVLGVTGAKAADDVRYPYECWRVVAAVRSGGSVSIYDCTDGVELVAGPSAVSTGTIASVRFGGNSVAAREWAVFDSALNEAALVQKALAMIGRSGGASAVERYVTHDGVEILTYPHRAPWTYKDDAGACRFQGANWVLGGAVLRSIPNNDVHRSDDNGRTWQQITQIVPFVASDGVAGFALTIG